MWHAKCVMRIVYSIISDSIWANAGSQLWVKQRGMCHWPVVMWSLDLCMKKDIPQLLESFKDGELNPRLPVCQHLQPTHSHHDSHDANNLLQN